MAYREVNLHVSPHLRHGVTQLNAGQPTAAVVSPAVIPPALASAPFYQRWLAKHPNAQLPSGKFAWFLRRANRLSERHFSPSGLPVHPSGE